MDQRILIQDLDHPRDMDRSSVKRRAELLELKRDIRDELRTATNYIIDSIDSFSDRRHSNGDVEFKT